MSRRFTAAFVGNLWGIYLRRKGVAPVQADPRDHVAAKSSPLISKAAAYVMRNKDPKSSLFTPQGAAAVYAKRNGVPK